MPAGPDGRPGIRAAMAALAEQGITRLLVEGGPALAASLLAADLIDEAQVFRGTAQAAGERIHPFGSAGLRALTEHATLRLHGQRQIDTDCLSVYRRIEFW